MTKSINDKENNSLSFREKNRISRLEEIKKGCLRSIEYNEDLIKCFDKRGLNKLNKNDLIFIIDKIYEYEIEINYFISYVKEEHIILQLNPSKYQEIILKLLIELQIICEFPKERLLNFLGYRVKEAYQEYKSQLIKSVNQFISWINDINIISLTSKQDIGHIDYKKTDYIELSLDIDGYCSQIDKLQKSGYFNSDEIVWAHETLQSLLLIKQKIEKIKTF